eukprot:TRINITY_DN471_c0_g6_i1.p1 TRINITY_DN471_c0_g6~~TRINITY_DN471_c0_g6_i1.p1  ORF type:complete len:298 (-),score=114.30 TRINITY_DN471_c0_g6_i1:43-936(-)
MAEHGTCAAKAAVYIDSGGWQAGDSGLSNIDVYCNPSTGSYRVVAIDAQNTSHHPINSNIWADLAYSKSSSTFHQWRDQAGRTYGLNFASQSDADTFERGMSTAVAKLKQGASQGGATAMAGLNLDTGARGGGGGGAARPAQQTRSSAMGHGARAAGGAMMQTMPKDMSAAFSQQRDADIAAFRSMSSKRKSGAPASPRLSRASPPSGPRGGSSEYAKSPLSGDYSSGGGGKPGGGKPGGGKSGGGKSGGDNFTSAELNKWKESVLSAARSEINAWKDEMLAALSGRRGGGGGGGGW